MSRIKVPSSFNSVGHFKRWAISVAIRDRQAFVHAWTPKYSEPDEEAQEIIDETLEEIEALKQWKTQIK